jgi:uncharacterized protein YecE (DUF72 family)
VRFHGSGTGHGGNYSRKSLENWAERLSLLARAVDDVYVYFNNDAFGHATRNAMTLTELIAEAAPRSVVTTAKT